MKASLPLDKLQRIRDIAKTYCAFNISPSNNYSLSSVTSTSQCALSLKDDPSSPVFWTQQLPFPNLHDNISLDEGCRSDRQLWSHLLDHWNGVAFFYDDLVHSFDYLQFFTDAAPSVGFGGFFQGQWFASVGLPPSQNTVCRPRIWNLPHCRSMSHLGTTLGT